ncbi:MAG: uracil-DNA glycosylase [Firmicutes bacterium]|nr:uracil-DNA glycosylase [Bacillota bacterium]
MTWEQFFKEESQKEYAHQLHTFLDEEYKNFVIYPPRKNIFHAFDLTPLDKVRVVIIGQDPYHEPGQAMGLSFSVPSGCPLPPSLQNIYKELNQDLGLKMKNNGDLSYLSSQGVLLLNAILSVRQGQASSHQGHGYEEFLKNTLLTIDKCDQPIVFFLWGNFARQLKPYITNHHRLIIESVHPSPLSANRGGFFGLHQFSRCNQFLAQNGQSPINWQN